jgi:alkylated DNA nucleotide flippase Atl1
VLHHLVSDVRYGHTASYRTVASLAGNPAAVRAVGVLAPISLPATSVS